MNHEQIKRDEAMLAELEQRHRVLLDEAATFDFQAQRKRSQMRDIWPTIERLRLEKWDRDHPSSV